MQFFPVKSQHHHFVLLNNEKYMNEVIEKYVKMQQQSK